MPRSRHGRADRFLLVRPPLKQVDGREVHFEENVRTAFDLLRELHPEALAHVSFSFSLTPRPRVSDPTRPDRWWIIDGRHIVFARSPILHTPRPASSIGVSREEFIARCVFEAVAEILGRDPWELMPDEY